MYRLLLVLGLIEGLVEGLSSNRGSTNATTGSGANAGQTPDEYCQSLCGSPPTSICGDKGSYCKPYGPPENGVGVCQGFYYLPNNSMCYFGPFTTSSECPEEHPVFCGGNATTTPGPTPTPTTGPTPTPTTGPTPTPTTGPAPTTPTPTTGPTPTPTTGPAPTTPTPTTGPAPTTTPGPNTTFAPNTTQPSPTTTPGPNTTFAPNTTQPSPTTTPGTSTTPGPITTPSPSPAPYPTGFFNGSGTVAGATFNISALFSDNTTVLEDMNVTVPGLPPIQIEQLPYTMNATRLNITDFSKVPSEFRQFMQIAEIDYYSGNQTIFFSIPGVVNVTLSHPSSSRRLKR